MLKTLLVTEGCGFTGSNFVRFSLHQHLAENLANLDKLTYAGNLAAKDRQGLPFRQAETFE